MNFVLDKSEQTLKENFDYMAVSAFRRLCLVYADIAELASNMKPFPEEEFGNVHLVHSPCHTHAAAKSEDGSSDKEQYPRRVEGKYG